MDSVLSGKGPKAVVPLDVLSLRSILAGLLLLATEVSEAVQVPEGSGPMALWGTMVPVTLLPAPSPVQQSFSI